MQSPFPPPYRGRLAPSPTGYLHRGHGRTFWIAHLRAREAGGVLVFRNEDLDPARRRPEFSAAALEDLRWLGCEWQEGPDVGGPFGPYEQSRRRASYEAVFERLRAGGFLYPCTCSRREVQAAAGAPHEGGDEPLYSGACRPERLSAEERVRRAALPRGGVNWRFRVPEGETLRFVDGHFGPQAAQGGNAFGDFLVWRRDEVPAYQLAVVADDLAMRITEVVRGADLILSTFRQLLLYRALQAEPPGFFHCPLVTDESGARLAKRSGAVSLRTLRERGLRPEAVRSQAP